MTEILGSLGNVSPVIGAAAQAANVATSLVPATPGKAVVSSPAKPGFTKELVKFAPRLGGAAVGAYVWKKHRILGAVLGNAVAEAGFEFYKGEKTRAACELLVDGAAVFGALKYKGGKSPLVGFVGGLLAGSIVSYFIPGSPAKDEFNWLKSKLGK